jgi:ELWxxDGT repeat protein
MTWPIYTESPRSSIAAYPLSRSVARRIYPLLCAALLALAFLPVGRSAALGDGPVRLVKDINTETHSSAPHDFTVVGNTAYFLATDRGNNLADYRALWAVSSGTTVPRRIKDEMGPHTPLVERNGILFFSDDNRLWRTDGTFASTFPIGDANYILGLINVSGTLFFHGSDGTGSGLWKTDGSSAGTLKVKTTPLPTTDFVPVGEFIFFITEGLSDGFDLWRSDGTPTGTMAIKHFQNPPSNAAPASAPAQFPWPEPPPPPSFKLLDVNGTLFFVINIPEFNYSGLWRSDGTPAGTTLVTDVVGIDSLSGVGDMLYFIGNDDSHGYELWKSDGTPAGTSLVKDILPGPISSAIHSISSTNGQLFFFASDGVHGWEPWRSDGTAAGTSMVMDINPGGTSHFNTAAINNLNGTVFFIADDGIHGPELWRSDGTAAGTSMVENIRPGADDSEIEHLTSVDGKLFFFANDGVHGAEPWISDGTPSATRMIKDIDPSPLGSVPTGSPFNIASLNGMLLFSADDGMHGDEPWISDGTAAGTLGMDINTISVGSYPTALTDVNGSLFFIASQSHGSELWKSAGVEAGASRIDPGNEFFAYELTSMNDRLFLIAADKTHNRSLWQSDGTPGGTRLVKDIGQDISGLTNANGKLFFLGDDGIHGQELWRSDGTPAGTVMVKDINTADVGAYITELTQVNGTLFFAAADPTHGHELWKSDGTPGGTTLVKDIHPGAQGSGISGLADVQGTLFFAADDGAHGRELWKSDGTPGGTTLVKDIVPGGESSFGDRSRFTAARSLAFFFANDSSHGLELWKSDGTSTGTIMLKDIFPGLDGSRPILNYDSLMAGTDKALFLVANDGVHGEELWASDGTPAGTGLLKDIVPGPGDPEIQNLAVINETLFFMATGAGGQRGLWRSDGTPTGTRLVQVFGPVSNPPSMAAALSGTSLFFSADDGRTGQELWGIPLSAGVGTTVVAPAQASAARAGVAGIPIAYQNTGLLPATTVALSATLSAGLSYVGNTSGSAPVISGNTLTWRLRDLGFIDGADFRLLVQVPDAPLGTRYPITIQLNAGGITRTTQVEIITADLHYLPVLAR